MTEKWPWYPGAWNDFADGSFNATVGCSNVNCTEREKCWARRAAMRRKPQYGIWTPEMGKSAICLAKSTAGEHLPSYLKRGCQDCYDFMPHEHFERWEKFRAKPGERIALGWMGDLFDPARSDKAILDHLIAAKDFAGMGLSADPICRYLIQTRHILRALSFITGSYTDMACFELGTTLSSPVDIENVRALAELPDDVVRFIAFEPIDTHPGWFCGLGRFEVGSGIEAVAAAKPNWVYIGRQTPTKPCSMVSDCAIRFFGDELRKKGINVIFKQSCGPELYAQNEGVTLP